MSLHNCYLFQLIIDDNDLQFYYVRVLRSRRIWHNVFLIRCKNAKLRFHSRKQGNMVLLTYKEIIYCSAMLAKQKAGVSWHIVWHRTAPKHFKQLEIINNST